MAIKLSKVQENNKIKQLSSYAAKLDLNVYLVGGALRDVLQGKKMLDLDIVAEGNPSGLVKELAQKWHAKITAYRQFGTYILKLKDNSHIDFATARKEKYPKPGSLPLVSFSNLKEDLYRRDFTINAMALGLSGINKGKILDLYGGKADLKNRRLKVLHERSFIDDPTRILRLARFMGRGYKPEKNTLKYALRDKNYLKRVSIERIREELFNITDEQTPSKSLNLLFNWGVMGVILPEIKAANIKKLDSVKTKAERINAILSGLPKVKRLSVMRRLKLQRTLKNEIESLNKTDKIKPILSGNDLIKLGYEPGPAFKAMLNNIAKNTFISRQKAIRFVIDNYPQKR